jgi:ABC-type uncharacterized transport system substrate-binding protein
MQFHQWKRREVITLLGGAAAWPVAAHAQQTGRPIIGFLGSSSGAADNVRTIVEHLRRGLGDTGFVEGHNLVVEYRWAEGRYERLPALAAELVRHPVAVLVAGGITATVAAKAATATIPIVFYTGGDPVKLGLVGSLNKPDGNATGAVQLGKQLVAKQLELLHDLMPKADAIAFLVNPKNAASEDETNEMQAAARALGQSCLSSGPARRTTSPAPLRPSCMNGPARSSCKATRSSTVAQGGWRCCRRDMAFRRCPRCANIPSRAA